MGEHRTLSRRLVLTGMGLTGVTAANAILPAGSHAASSTAELDGAEPTVHAVTIADLRAATDPDPAAIYFVTDANQQGAFYFDAADTQTADNTGIVLVSASGHRFKRIFGGPVRLAWFGAKADYDPVSGAGASSDDAFTLALAALEDYALRGLPEGGGFRRGLPTIAFEAGNYLFTEKGYRPEWFRAIQGLRLEGHGMHQTNVYLDIPESQNGTDNYFILNDGTEGSNPGVVSTFSMEGITFWGVSGTERFMLYADTPGGGVAKRLYFTQCSWHFLKVGFDIAGRANSDHMRFLDCLIQDNSEDSIFFNSNNPQAQNHDFVNCNFATRGKIFNFKAGGNLHVRGCQITTRGNGIFLNIDDSDGGSIGIGNSTYNLIDINPEIRDQSKLLYVNAPEAKVTFINPRLITGNAQNAANWTEGESYVVGDRVRAGVGEVPVPSKQRAFRCIQAHTASEASRPRTGEDWETHWEATFELQIDAGAVQIRGGSLSLSTLLTYTNDSHENARLRPALTISDGCRLVNPVHDLVDVVPLETITNSASKPRVIATGCRPYTGNAQDAYASTPTDPVDVSLNAQHGFDGATAPVNRFIFRASPAEGEGLPSIDDEDQTFLLPRGAHVLRVRLVSNELTSADGYTITNHDGSVSFLSPGGNPHVDHWYEIDSEAARTFIVASMADERVEGLILIEYV